MNPDDLRIAAFLVLTIALTAVVAYAMWATDQLDQRMNFPNINANAVVLIGIAGFILLLVVLVVFRGARYHNDRFDQEWIDHYRDDDEGRGVGG